MEKSVKIELWIAAVAVIVIAAIGVALYFFYVPKLGTTATTTVAKKDNCEALNVTSGENTAMPVLASVLNKNASINLDICSWTVNGKASHTSFPVGGKCLFGGKNIGSAGTYTIGLNVTQNSCSLTKEVTVK